MPGVCCEQCRDNYQEDEIEPDCLDGKCPVGFDLLTKDDLRILEAKTLLDKFGDGLADRICRELMIGLDELRIIAALEDEEEKLNPKPSPRGESWQT